MEESTSGWGEGRARDFITVLQSKSNHREIPRGPRSLGGIFIAILFPNSAELKGRFLATGNSDGNLGFLIELGWISHTVC